MARAKFEIKYSVEFLPIRFEEGRFGFTEVVLRRVSTAFGSAPSVEELGDCFAVHTSAEVIDVEIVKEDVRRRAVVHREQCVAAVVALGRRIDDIDRWQRREVDEKSKAAEGG